MPITRRAALPGILSLPWLLTGQASASLSSSRLRRPQPLSRDFFLAEPQCTHINPYLGHDYLTVNRKTHRLEANRDSVEKALKAGNIARADMDAMLLGYFHKVVEVKDKPLTIDGIKKLIAEQGGDAKDKLEREIILFYLTLAARGFNSDLTADNTSLVKARDSRGQHALFALEAPRILDTDQTLTKMGYPFSIKTSTTVSSAELVDYREKPTDRETREGIRVNLTGFNPNEDRFVSMSLIAPINRNIVVNSVGMDGKSSFQFIDLSGVIRNQNQRDLLRNLEP